MLRPRAFLLALIANIIVKVVLELQIRTEQRLPSAQLSRIQVSLAQGNRSLHH